MDNKSCAPACRIRPAPDPDCGCERDRWGLYEYPLAMVYAPLQAFRNLYDPETALRKGTLFSELDKPLESVTRRGGACRGGFTGREERT